MKKFGIVAGVLFGAALLSGTAIAQTPLDHVVPRCRQ